jgi:hypothetical protein
MASDHTVTASFATSMAQIDFWSNDGTDGRLTVSVDGSVVGTLNSYFLYPQTPAWGAAGTLIATVTPGTHLLSATSQSGTVSWPAKSVTLTPGEQYSYQFVVTQWCFWTDRGDVGSYINIEIDGRLVGQLTQYTSVQPTWGASGTLVVTTNPGTHTLYAISQGGTYWGPASISLVDGQQQFYELR